MGSAEKNEPLGRMQLLKVFDSKIFICCFLFANPYLLCIAVDNLWDIHLRLNRDAIGTQAADMRVVVEVDRGGW